MPRNVRNRRFYSKIGQKGNEAKQQKKQLRQQQATIASNAAKRRREETGEGRPPVPKTREESTQTNTKESCDAIDLIQMIFILYCFYRKLSEENNCKKA
uniref:Uncharacterized protein n=1 Tax=Meloidogyne hapla TaxID=6305 RepID=A0A1I8B3P2_MELHA